MTLDNEKHEEYQYLDLIRSILKEGEERIDRTKTGTLSIFGPPQLKFSLNNNRFPLLTTKRVFFRGVVEELLWFIKGDTNAKHLQDKKVHIWDGNASREYWTHRKKRRKPWTSLWFSMATLGAEYKDCDTDYTGKGVDQLAQVIDKINNNPTDRRIILSAWNPADLNIMALPPCHMFCQFFVHFTRFG